MAHADIAPTDSPGHWASVVKKAAGRTIGSQCCQTHNDLRRLLHRPVPFVRIKIRGRVTGSCGIHTYSAESELLGERHCDGIQKISL